MTALVTAGAAGPNDEGPARPGNDARVIIDLAASDEPSITDPIIGTLDGSRLELHYQPIVRVSDDATVGFEGLLRRVDPPNGDASSTARPVGDAANRHPGLAPWVVATACNDATLWSGRGTTTYVNVSPLQMAQPGLVEHVIAMVEFTGLAPDDLGIELTESHPMSPAALSALMQLHRLGVRIVLDDLGARHADVAAMHTLPLDAVKFDRSLVANLAQCTDTTRYVSAAVAMAHCNGLEVIAEGIETPQQLTVAAEFGFDLAQGYLLGRPEPAESAVDALTAATEPRQSAGTPAPVPAQEGSLRCAPA